MLSMIFLNWLIYIKIKVSRYVWYSHRRQTDRLLSWWNYPDTPKRVESKMHHCKNQTKGCLYILKLLKGLNLNAGMLMALKFIDKLLCVVVFLIILVYFKDFVNPKFRKRNLMHDFMKLSKISLKPSFFVSFYSLS